MKNVNPDEGIPSGRADTARAGALFVLGGLLFLLLTTASEAIYPGFSLQTNSISDLGAIGTPTTATEEAAILGLGACWCVGTYYLFRSTQRKGTMVIYMLPSVGFLLAGVSPENVNIIIHSAGALIAFPIGGIVAILSYRAIRSAFRFFAVALGAVALASTFVIFVGQQIVGPCGTCVGSVPSYVQSLNELGLGLGGWESMIIYPLLIWLLGFGSYLLTAASFAGAQEER